MGRRPWPVRGYLTAIRRRQALGFRVTSVSNGRGLLTIAGFDPTCAVVPVLPSRKSYRVEKVRVWSRREVPAAARWGTSGDVLQRAAAQAPPSVPRFNLCVRRNGVFP